MAFNYSPKIVTDGLVLYLDAANRYSYPGSGTTWSDISRGGNNGTLTNGPTFNSANGGSIVFDGVDDYVNCGNGTSIQLIGDMSILTWINVTNFNNFRGIVGKTTSNIPAPYDYYLTQTSGKPRFIRGNGGSSAAVDATNAPTINTWQHIAVTMLGTQVTHYLNAQTNGSGTATVAIANGSNNLIIGSRSDFVTLFLGNIANTQIYNRALSATEILQNYNATKTRFGL